MMQNTQGTRNSAVWGAASLLVFSTAVSPTWAAESLPPEYQRIVQDAADSLRSTRFFADSDAVWISPHFDAALELAHDWPRPELRDALLYLLDMTNRDHLYHTLGALTSYDDPLVDSAVRRFVDDKRKVGPDYNVITISQLVKNVLEPASPLDLFVRADHLLPAAAIDQYGDVSIIIDEEGERWRKMTVPAAMDAVQSDDLSIRLQAWLWLAARHGIVLDPRPLEDAWPSMDLPRQKTIAMALLYRTRFVIGGERLRPFLAKRLEEWENLDPTMRAQLLVVAGRVLTPGAKERAKKIIAQAAGNNEATAQPTNGSSRWELDERVANAFMAFAYEAENSDLETVLQWTRAPSRLVRNGAAYVLAGLEDWVAVYAVLGQIAHPEGLSYVSIGADDRFEGGLPTSKEMKWTYVRAIGRMLAQEMQLTPLREDGRIALKYIRLLRMLTGWKLGWEGVRTASIDFDALRDTAEKWRRWIDKNDPMRRALSPPKPKAVQP